MGNWKWKMKNEKCPPKKNPQPCAQISLAQTHADAWQGRFSRWRCHWPCFTLSDGTWRRGGREQRHQCYPRRSPCPDVMDSFGGEGTSRGLFSPDGSFRSRPQYCGAREDTGCTIVHLALRVHAHFCDFILVYSRARASGKWEVCSDILTHQHILTTSQKQHEAPLQHKKQIKWLLCYILHVFQCILYIVYAYKPNQQNKAPKNTLLMEMHQTTPCLYTPQ